MSRLAIAFLALLAFAVAPSSTMAVTATVTGDAGEAVPLGAAAPTLRNIAPSIAFGFDPEEKRYSFSVRGPAGDEAAAPLACNTNEYATPEDVWYRGNGVYTVIVLASKNPEDANCTDATETRFQFTINATTTVIPPPGILKTRESASGALVHHPFAVQVVPGTSHYDVQYAVNPKFNPDGSIAGEHGVAEPDKDTGKETLTIGIPGRYAFVARATSARGFTPASTPWSPPVYVTVMAPFGVDTVLSNAHFRAVRINGNVTEAVATGAITVSIAKGRKGGSFRKLATRKLDRSGRFTLKFKVRAAGAYRLKYTYKGDATVIAGSATEVVRLTR